MTAPSLHPVSDRRILLLITDLEIGGTPTVVRELATRLQPFAHAEVACLKKWGPVADQLRASGVTVTAFEASRVWQFPQTVRRLRHLLKDRKIDTVLSFLVHGNALAAAALRALPGVRGIQSIQTVQPSPAWHWHIQRVAQEAAERFVMPSNAIVRAAGERSGVPVEKCVVIPNAVDPAAYLPNQVFAGPVTRVGCIGRLDPAKQPELLLAMMPHVDASVELHYFGDGGARASMETRALPWKNCGRIAFHGTVAGPHEALRQIDCLMLPSAVEGFGLVLIEAMAAGVPVVACGAGGVLDVVTHELNGLLVSPDPPSQQPQRYAAALSRVMADRELRTRLIAGGLRTVRQRFSWDVVLPQYRSVLGV